MERPHGEFWAATIAVSAVPVAALNAAPLADKVRDSSGIHLCRSFPSGSLLFTQIRLSDSRHRHLGILLLLSVYYFPLYPILSSNICWTCWTQKIWNLRGGQLLLEEHLGNVLEMADFQLMWLVRVRNPIPMWQCPKLITELLEHMSQSAIGLFPGEELQSHVC